MPLYEYLCNKCGHRFERIQRFSDPMVKKCPECGEKVEQVISAPAVQFKGSGWYVTDYAKKPSGGSSSGGSAKSDSEHKSDSDRKSDSERTSDQKSDSDRKSKSEVKSGSGKDNAKKESQPRVGSSAGKGDKK